MTTITSTTYTLDGLTTILQRRRRTQHDRYIYEKREIRAWGEGVSWYVRTFPWKLRFTHPIGRAR